MKKIFLTMMTTAMIFASCSNEEGINNANENENDLVEIKLGAGSRVGVTGRAAGIPVEEWNNTQVGIFALDTRGTTNTDGTTTLVWNDADAEVDNKAVLLQNEACTISSGNVDNEVDITFNDGETHYYPRKTDRLYNFYGYYPYSENVNITKSEGSEIENTVVITGNFDGSQDILAGTTNATERPSNAWNGLYYRDNDNATNPVIEFKHMTSRFIVKLRKGDDTFDADMCTVTDITMDLPTTYNLTLASLDQTITAPSIVFGTEVAEKVSVIAENTEGFIADDTAVQAADFMVPAGSNTATFYIKFNDENETVTPINLLFDEHFTADETNQGEDEFFKPGMIYTITLTIYGPQAIDIKGTLEEWKEGGSFELEA